MRLVRFASAGARRRPSSMCRWLALAGLLAASGCGPTPPTSAELGEVVYDIERMPGAHKRFLLPETKGEAEDEAAAAGGAGRPPQGHPPDGGHTHADDAPGGK